MLKYPGMLQWDNLQVHRCYSCRIDVGSDPLCSSCAEKMERNVVEFLEKPMPSSDILTLHKMMQVVLSEGGNN